MPDAIVVLGCRVLSSGGLTPMAERRARAAASAFHAGVAPILVASGGRRWGDEIEARAIARWLRDAGVPGDAIVEELWSMSTYENAVFTEVILSARGLSGARVKVVTCPWHMPRALENFRGAGLDPTAWPADHGPAGTLTRAYRVAHEVASGWLDRRARGRTQVLREAARAHARERP